MSWSGCTAGALVQIIGCAALLLLDASSPIWLLALIGTVIGIPQGLNGLANQNALYAQADPARIGSSAGLLRTFMYVGALLASAANATFYKHGATTGGLHHLSWLLLVVAAMFLIATVADRSLSRIGHDADSADGHAAGDLDDGSENGARAARR